MNRKITTILASILTGSVLCSCASSAPVNSSDESSADMAVDATTVLAEESNATEAVSTEVVSTEAAAASLVHDDSRSTIDSATLDTLNLDGERWFSCKEDKIATATFSFFRADGSYIQDDDGYVYITSSIYNSSKYEILKYNARDNVIADKVRIDTNTNDDTDLYETDVICYPIGDTEYVEIDKYRFVQRDNDKIEVVADVRTLDSYITGTDEKVNLLNKNEIVTNSFRIGDETCLAVMIFNDEDLWGNDCELRFYKDSLEPTKVIPLEEITDDEVKYVESLAISDDGNYIVKYFDENFNDSYVTVNSDNEISYEVPSYINLGTRFFNYKDELFVYDDTALYVVVDGVPQKFLDSTCITDGSVDFEVTRPLAIYDDSISFIGYDYSTGEDFVIKTFSLCDFPFEGREKIVVGCPKYSLSIVAEQIALFNSTNEKYYAVPFVISTEGVNPAISKTEVEARIQELMENIPVTVNDEYFYDMAEECAFSMELEKFISGPDAPDVIATEGHWAQLNEPGVLEDISYIYENLSSEEYYTNIFDASSKVGSRFVPVFFFMSGIVDFGDNPVEDTIIKDVSYSEYINLINNSWDGQDPLSVVCTSEQYVEELISSQYDLYVNRDSNKVDFANNENFDRMMSYMIYSVWPDMNGSDYDYGSDYYYTKIYSPYDFYTLDQNGDGCPIWPIPSSDGRGIEADPMLCLGIPSGSNNKDAAEAFITFTLTYDAQMLCEIDNFGIPVRRDAAIDIMRGANKSTTNNFNDFVSNINNIYVVDAQLRYACYGPIVNLSEGKYDNEDYAPEAAGRDIEKNMEYFMQEEN